MQGFYFALLQYSPIQAFTACFALSMQLYRTCRKTAHRALQWLLLRFVQFNRRIYQTDTNGYNTTCTTLEHITAPGRPIDYTRYHRHTWTPHRSAQPPIIIRYIRAQQCACYRPMPDSATHRRPCQPGGAVQQQGARRAARNHWRLPPYLFSGFCPIANRGKQ